MTPAPSVLDNSTEQTCAPLFWLSIDGSIFKSEASHLMHRGALHEHLELFKSPHLLSREVSGGSHSEAENPFPPPLIPQELLLSTELAPLF